MATIIEPITSAQPVNGGPGTSKNATVIDPGPVKPSAPGTGVSRQATVIDTGVSRRATVIDTGVSLDTGASRQATIIDAGTPKPQAAAFLPGPTAEDAGGLLGIWQRVFRELEASSSESITKFSNLKIFKNAAAGLTELSSGAGKKYKVKGTLSRDGGQAALLLCSDMDGHDVVAKIYYEDANSSSTAYMAKGKLYQYLDNEPDQHYLLPVLDLGVIRFAGQPSPYFFEILPFCPDGNLEDSHRAFSYAELLPAIRQLNEALHIIHLAGLLHRDLKPANLYYYQNNIVIGDFGVARVMDDQTTHISVYSDGYSAPETRTALTSNEYGEKTYYYDDKCDYYSLGVTIATLYEGHYIYEGMGDGMAILIRDSKLPLTRHDEGRKELENLIHGLCQYDPRQRFGYEEVCFWLQNPAYSVVSSAGNRWPQPFRMSGQSYDDERSLFEGISGSRALWETGKKMLYSKIMENFFGTFRTDLALRAQQCDEKWRVSDPDKGLAEFLLDLWPDGPLSWQGTVYRSLSDLGKSMMTAADSQIDAYGEMLKRGVVSSWVRQRTSNGSAAERERFEKAARIVEEIETFSRESTDGNKSNTTREQVYWFGFTFAPKRQLQTASGVVSDIPGLISALFQNANTFYTGGDYDNLMDREQGAALYGFLYSLGCKSLLDKVWDSFNAKTGEDQKFTTLLAVLEIIGKKTGANVKPIGRFYRQFGPLGIATKTIALIKEGDIYQALDGRGAELCAKISDFSIPTDKSIGDTMKLCAPLFQYMAQFRNLIADDPFCIAFGAFDPQGIVCLNLSGSFSFRIFGMTAPLAFASYIQKGA